MEYHLPNHISGDTFNGLDFQVLYNGEPKDLTGFTIKMEVKPTRKSTAALTLSNSEDGGIEITNALEGRFRISEQVISIKPMKYLYDIQFTLDQYIKTWLSGTWTILNDITT